MTTLTPEELRDAAQRARESVDSWPAFLFDRAADELERLRAQVEPLTPTVEDINAQQWAGMDGATAFLLIDRHAEGWAHCGRLMEAWRTANAAPAQQAEPYGHAYTVNGVHQCFDRGAEPPPDDAYDAGSLVPVYTGAPSMTVGDDGLPPLPHPRLRFEVAISPTGDRLDYSAKDMRAYAREALAAVSVWQFEPAYQALLAARKAYAESGRNLIQAQREWDRVRSESSHLFPQPTTQEQKP